MEIFSSLLILVVLLGSIEKFNMNLIIEDISSCVDNISDEDWASEIKVFDTSKAEMSQLPKSFDWRDKGAIAPVKNQGVCGCCWAMAAIAAIESTHYIFNASHRLEQLAPQILIDCVGANQGCESGDVRQAFIYAAKSPGLLREADYPYKATQQPCKPPEDYTPFRIDGYAALHSYADVIMEAVTRQPLVVTVHIGPEFKNYRSGIFKGPCGKSGHSLLLVGYGETYDGENYWILKNSWGEGWGEKGYVKMPRDFSKNGFCDLYTRVIYPIPYLGED